MCGTRKFFNKFMCGCCEKLKEEDEIELLKKQKEFFKQQLEEIEKKIKEIEKQETR